MQVLNFVPLLGSAMLHVAFVGTLLQRVDLSFPPHIGGAVVATVCDEIVLVGDHVGETFRDQIQRSVKQIFLLNGRISNVSPTVLTECVFELFDLCEKEIPKGGMSFQLKGLRSMPGSRRNKYC